MSEDRGYTIIPNGSREESVICIKCRRPFEEGELVVDRPHDPWPGSQMIRHHEVCNSGISEASGQP